jgi:DnaJ-class molecular chaperone
MGRNDEFYSYTERPVKPGYLSGNESVASRYGSASGAHAEVREATPEEKEASRAKAKADYAALQNRLANDCSKCSGKGKLYPKATSKRMVTCKTCGGTGRKPGAR